MSNTSIYTRRDKAADRLAQLRATRPEFAAQRYENWLEIATSGEVRRAWRPWMGACPGWAGERPVRR